MKTKLKKHLFTRKERDELLAMLNSRDKECYELAKQIIRTSSTFKHYHKHLDDGPFIYSFNWFVERYSR